MKVKIDKSVFLEAKDADRQLELSFLLHIILYKHRYTLKVIDGEILDSDSFSKLMQSEQMTIKEEITKSIISSNTEADCVVKIGGEQEWKNRVFSPTEAVMFLMQPLSVILENGFNDAHFIKAIFRCFDTTGKLNRYINEGWIRFENAGGCSNVKNFLKSHAGYYGENEKFLRCYVILDGDRRFPTDAEPAKKYKGLKEWLTKMHVGYHVLEKRCMENYMPDEAMNSFAGNETQKWIKAFKMLSPRQKDFICIAEGFVKDISKENKRKVSEKEGMLKTHDTNKRKKSYVKEYLPQEEKTFYHDVSIGNFLHLEKGLKIENFKTKYPEKYNETAFVYKSNLLFRTNHQDDPLELEHIVGDIISLL